MKDELTNSFIDGLKGLFKEHYFDIPEDKIEVVEEQAAEIDGLQSELNEAVTVVEALHTELVALKQKSITESVSGDLTKTERAKFVSLSEKIEFTSEEEYSEKLMTIKESYFPRGRVTSPIPQNDVPALITEESGKQTDEYIAHIAKNLKF
jgi:dynactin complex subunit